MIKLSAIKKNIIDKIIKRHQLMRLDISKNDWSSNIKNIIHKLNAIDAIIEQTNFIHVLLLVCKIDDIIDSKAVCMLQQPFLAHLLLGFCHSQLKLLYHKI